MNGHEHLMDYSYIPTRNDTVRPIKKQDGKPADCSLIRSNYDNPKDRFLPKEELKVCWKRREWFHEEDYPKVNRKAEFSKGDYVHEFTMGASGNFSAHLCQQIYDRSYADFKYASNNY